MPFKAFELALEAVRLLRDPLQAVAQRDPDLARQIRRATASMALNVSEGNRRRGRDRLHLWRVAAGSADEVMAALRVAEAWRYVSTAAIARPLDRCGQVVAILRSLTR